MGSNIKDKMEEFLSKANETLEDVQASSRANKKATNLLMWISSLLLIAILTFTVNTRIEVVRKADAQEVVFKKNAILLEQLRIENGERNFAVLADTTCKMEVIKKHNENYMLHVNSILDINYRGK